MNLGLQTKRIHPLVAVAATAVTIFSLVGIAAITGVLPSSHGTGAAEQPQAMEAPASGADNWDQSRPAGKQLQAKAISHGNSNTNAGAAPVSAQTTANQGAPVAQAPAHKAPQNSAVGIGVGAVVGGVLGNQIGQGDGKTLATILGAVGGGYVGNEIAKKNQ
jgi:hypothetical protein